MTAAMENKKKREQMVTDYTAGSTSVMQVKLEENQQFLFWMLIVFRRVGGGASFCAVTHQDLR